MDCFSRKKEWQPDDLFFDGMLHRIVNKARSIEPESYLENYLANNDHENRCNEKNR